MKHWYNNGTEVKYCEECPEGFKLGRINKKPTEAEQRNLETINNLLKKFSSEQIISYYREHTVSESASFFNVSDKILKKVLIKLNYDFSVRKESTLKGKAAVRSKESYIEGGKKSAQTQKQNWKNKSEEEKLAWSTKQSLAHLNSPTFRDKIIASNKAYRNSLTEEQRLAIDKQRSESMKNWWESLTEDEKNQVVTNRFKTGQSYHQKDSLPNLQFAELLINKSINFEREFCLDKKMFDFKIDNILVEINPTFTHNSTFTPFEYNKPLDKFYHLNKTEVANKYNFRCIHIFDWEEKEKVVKLLQTDREQIYARNCEIKEVSKQEAIDFICENHLQGYAKDEIRLGLYYKDNLVSIMTFGKPRYNKNYEYELVRYCASKNIIGGADKLFKHFIKQFNVKSLLSYCDLSKFSGQTYEKLGFSLLRKSGPTKHWYNVRTKEHYTDNLLRQRGFSQLIHNKTAEEDNLVGYNNRELMISAGFVEIYDCGQATYLWKKEQ